MRFKHKLAAALLIQPLGVGSLFLTVWYLGNYESIELQGYFSTLKSQIDLLVAILIFGLPQSVIYQINSQNASRKKLIAATAVYSVIGLLALALFNSVFGESLGRIYNGTQINLAVISTVGALVFHRIVRGIFVTVHDDWRFSVVTISPSVVLAVIVILTLALTMGLSKQRICFRRLLLLY